MGYETKAYIVSASRSGSMKNKFTKYQDSWVNLWDETLPNGEVQYYHYTQNGNDKTIITGKFEAVERQYCSVLGMVDLCKLGAGNNVPKKETNFYFYNSDGNTVCIEDKYGDKLNQMTLDEAIDFFEDQRGYRRVDMLYSLMQTVKECFQDQDIYVLFYGY